MEWLLGVGCLHSSGIPGPVGEIISIITTTITIIERCLVPLPSVSSASTEEREKFLKRRSYDRIDCGNVAFNNFES